MRVPILLYHRVGPSRPGSHASLNIPPTEFERQMDWLAARGCRGVSASDASAGTSGRRSVAITFDDAYEDVALYALPILEARGFCATVFVVTGQVGGTNVWDSADTSTPLRLMDRQQIQEWSRRGMEVGGHSRSHANLTLLDRSALECEVAGSSADLKAILGISPRCFAYPYGRYNGAVLQCVREHYESALTVNVGLNREGADPHLRRRTMVWPGESWLSFGALTALGYYPPRQWKRRIGAAIRSDRRR